MFSVRKERFPTSQQSNRRETVARRAQRHKNSKIFDLQSRKMKKSSKMCTKKQLRLTNNNFFKQIFSLFNISKRNSTEQFAGFFQNKLALNEKYAAWTLLSKYKYEKSRYHLWMWPTAVTWDKTNKSKLTVSKMPENVNVQHGPGERRRRRAGRRLSSHCGQKSDFIFWPRGFGRVWFHREKPKPKVKDGSIRCQRLLIFNREQSHWSPESLQCTTPARLCPSDTQNISDLIDIFNATSPELVYSCATSSIWMKPI